jgi:hypothetical protein
MRKEDTIFGIWWLVLVGNRRRFPSIWLAKTTMLEFPMQWPVLGEIWVPMDWVWRKTFSLEYEKRGYHLWNMVVGLGWKPQAISQYLASYRPIMLEFSMQGPVLDKIWVPMD